MVTLALAFALHLGSARAQEPPCSTCPCDNDLDAALCACAPSVCNPPARPEWYVRLDGLAMRRDVHGYLNVASYGSNTQAWPVLTTSQFNQPFEGAGRIFVGHAFDGTRWDVEFSYFQLGQTDESLARNDLATNALGTQGNLFSPFTAFGSPTAMAGLDYNYRIAVRDLSWMDNGELNFRYIVPMPTDCPRLSFLLGIRHVTVRDEFNYQSFSNSPTPLGSAVSVQTHITNDLWGPQLGGLVELFGDRNVWLNIEGKGAICDNGSVQQSDVTVTTGGNTTQFNPRDTPHETAFVGDLALTVVARFTPHITGRFGYQAIWINDIGLGQRNFAPNGASLLAGNSVIDRNAAVTYHGPTAGIEFTW